MKTADFLPPKAFIEHLDRRRTPKRLMILGAFSMSCLAAATAVQIEARSQETKARIAETPDEHAQEAKVELQALYEQLETEAIRLDPLTEHIKMPTCSEILAGLATAVGKGTEIEKVSWDHEIHKNTQGVQEGSIVMRVTCKVSGDEVLLSLPAKLQALTGYSEAEVSRVELVKGRNDLIRADVTLKDEMNVPQALANKKAGKTRS